MGCRMCGALQGEHYFFGMNGPHGLQIEQRLMALKRVDGGGGWKRWPSQSDSGVSTSATGAG